MASRGGTSLSEVHVTIERLWEDVDVTLGYCRFGKSFCWSADGASRVVIGRLVELLTENWGGKSCPRHRYAGPTRPGTSASPVKRCFPIPASSARTSYQRRVAQLRSFAAEDGIETGIPSESDFFDFACTELQTKAASLVPLDNGNLRAVWRSGRQEIGVQFCGGGLVQYLISREGGDGKIIHTARRGTLEQFWATIEGSGLAGLLYE